jgi:CRISPR-associated endonuclease/helicase Cas3
MASTTGGADVIASYWGKAKASQGRDVPFHAFACHCLDVIAVAECWLDMSSVLERSLCSGSERRIARAWILFFIGLHDIGKLDQRFQAKAPNAVKELAPERAEWTARAPSGFTHYDHGEMGYRWALVELHNYIAATSCDHGSLDTYWDAWRGWLEAVTGHHGVLPREVAPPSTHTIPKWLRGVDQSARRQWVATLEDMCLRPAGQWLGDVPPPAPQLLAGFCSVVDWVGSNTEFFPYARQPADLYQYREDRAANAKAALRASGLVSRATGGGGMAALFPERRPRQIQTLVDIIPRGPGLTLVEAPTGSGKTEAALSYAAHLLAARQADSIIFALPTQATANAMLARLEAVAPR